MGILVSIWSNVKKQGKTMFIYNFVKYLSTICKKDTRILLICLNSGYGNLLPLFNVKMEIALEDVLNFTTCSEGINFQNAVNKQDNLYFLGTKLSFSHLSRFDIEKYKKMFQNLKNSFDLIIVDTPSGTDNMLTNMLRKDSDQIINILEQDTEVLKSYPKESANDLLYIINMYRDIYPTLKEIKNEFGFENVFDLPLCDRLQEMKNKDKLEFYSQHDTEYNAKLIKIVDFFISKLDIQCEVVPNTHKKKNLFNFWGREKLYEFTQ